MKRITWVVFLFFIWTLSSCRMNSKEIEESKDVIETDDNSILRNYCANYASDYTIAENGEDATVLVSIEAPDFKAVIEQIIDEKVGSDITVQDLEEVVKSDPENVKKYVFTVNSLDKGEIEKGFIDEVSKDLIVAAIVNTDFTEEWSTEE